MVDVLHKTTREFVNWRSDSHVKEVVVGDVEGVECHTSPKKKGNQRKRSTKHNQRMSQWQFGRIHNYLKYKLEAVGISLQKVNEAYTTQTCPVCGRRSAPVSNSQHCYAA
ncbi:MAG: IS200/IS605 family accessory protein TnpB-related protein [Desulfitobacteriaceae bacterium]|nr:IS200/IS605 family accessory protein TnpB-related protein [Desulfitobacteriaceae bacterium]MDI6913139.1 IS200/IS605 family accessory protein TnpB-related protein [Desulfitobacteriaceae bacterium]